MTLAYTKKLDLEVRKANINAQKIDNIAVAKILF